MIDLSIIGTNPLSTGQQAGAATGERPVITGGTPPPRAETPAPVRDSSPWWAVPLGWLPAWMRPASAVSAVQTGAASLVGSAPAAGGIGNMQFVEPLPWYLRYNPLYIGYQWYAGQRAEAMAAEERERQAKIAAAVGLVALVAAYAIARKWKK